MEPKKRIVIVAVLFMLSCLNYARIEGTEDVDTKYGTINCLKVTPMVKSGRVFKEKEGVTLWISNDRNLIPVSIKAELAVGSLKASLDDYKNVKYPLAFK